MNSVTFSVLSTGETVERTYDSTGNQFRDKVIAINADCPAITAKRIADWQAYKMQSFMDYRANRATPIKRSKKTLQAIDYLLGDKYRDNRTAQQKRDDKEWAGLLATGTHADRIAYLERKATEWGNSLLKDRETVEAMKRFLSDSPYYLETERGIITQEQYTRELRQLVG